MRPLLCGFQFDSVLVWRGRERLSAAGALCAAHKLAAALPQARYVINLCESLDCFVVATMAALIGGRTLVLPPTRLSRTLDDLRARFADSVCLVDASCDGDAAHIG